MKLKTNRTWWLQIVDSPEKKLINKYILIFQRDYALIELNILKEKEKIKFFIDQNLIFNNVKFYQNENIMELTL